MGYLDPFTTASCYFPVDWMKGKHRLSHWMTLRTIKQKWTFLLHSRQKKKLQSSTVILKWSYCLLKFKKKTFLWNLLVHALNASECTILNISETSCSWAVLLQIQIICVHPYGLDVIWCIEFYFPGAGLLSRRQYISEIILQILSSNIVLSVASIHKMKSLFSFWNIRVLSSLCVFIRKIEKLHYASCILYS